MNIGMLLDKEFYGDLRVENEVRALAEAGFNVVVFSLNFHKVAGIDKYFGGTIVHIPVSKKVVYKLRGLTNTIFNFYPTYLKLLLKNLIIQYKIDVLHVHDLYLFEAGLKIKEEFRKLFLVGDLHENYTEALKHYKFSNTFPGNILISIKKWEKKEIEWLLQYDFLITVIEEAVERYKRLGISEEKFIVVANYVNFETFNSENIDEKIVNKFKNFNTLTYVGGFDSHRGIETAIKSVPSIIKKIKNFRLLLVGDGRNLFEMKLLVQKLKIEEFVIFEGWQKSDLLPSYIETSKICLIPHKKTLHTDNTIPHKLFQYMFLKKPVISSNCKPIERIITETKSGFIFESENENDLAEKVIDIFSDEKLQKIFAENGYNSVITKYNWKATSRNLVNLYKKIERENVER